MAVAPGRGSTAADVLVRGVTRVRLPVQRLRRGGDNRIVVAGNAGRPAGRHPIQVRCETERSFYPAAIGRAPPDFGAGSAPSRFTREADARRAAV